MRSLLAALLVALALPACEDKTVPDDGFDTMPMDVPPPEPTACRELATCTQNECSDDGDLWRLERRCEEADADPMDGLEPEAGCATVVADIETCLAMCQEAAGASDADRALVDEENSCVARAETADDREACDAIVVECGPA